MSTGVAEDLGDNVSIANNEEAILRELESSQIQMYNIDLTQHVTIEIGQLDKTHPNISNTLCKYLIIFFLPNI